MRAWTFATCLALSAASCAASALAQDPSSAAAPAASAPLPLSVRLNHTSLDPEAIRKAVELELKRPVTLVKDQSETTQSLSVVIHPDHSVTVAYRARDGLTRTRSIGLPEDAARSAEVIALLAGNLSRDEAAELLASLAAKARPSSAAAAAPSTDTPEASAPPDAPAQPSPTESKPAAVQPANEPAPPAHEALLAAPVPIDFSLFAPWALYRDSQRRWFNAELGLAYSHVGELRGFGLNVFVLHTERDVRGVSVATLYNRTDGQVSGLAAAAIANRTRDVLGAQVSGVLNLGSGEVQGLSLAGVANAQRDVLGVQAAGAFNRARRVEGLQLSGAVNVAQSVRGLQLGVVNVASEVEGVQLGVVNVARHVHGTSIGLVSVADNARLQALLWASSLMPIDAALKFTVGPLYTQAGLGYAPGNDTYTYELGVGAHLPLGRAFIEPGVHYSEMRSSKHPFDHELIEHAHYRISVGFDAGPVSPFVGVALLQRFAHRADAPSSDSLKLEGFGGVAFF